MAKMWAGRTSGVTDSIADDFNSSIHFDCRMYKQDIKGSMAHAAMLGARKIITEEEAKKCHILDRDGNVVYEYYDYNENVASVTYSPSEEDSFPIIVRTYDDLRAKNKRDTLVIVIFSFIYAFEALFSVSLKTPSFS